MINTNSADFGLRFDINMSINGQADIERALRNLAVALDEKQVKRAIRSARSRSLRAGRELGARLAREEYTARKAAIKSRFIASVIGSGEQAGLRLSGFPGMNLIEFQPNPKKPQNPGPKAGVTVRIKQKGSRHVAKGRRGGASKPFVAPLRKKGNELGIFVRYGQAKKRHLLFGPSPIQALLNPGRQAKIQARIEEMFERRLVHELDARLAGIVK